LTPDKIQKHVGLNIFKAAVVTSGNRMHGRVLKHRAEELPTFFGLTAEQQLLKGVLDFSLAHFSVYR
jgi:hypothetical protein